ncbi:aminotransferase class I/II-fold pyridoxal phosphate-dependent enzyme [Streptomyces somaliensis]|uniref:threonine aldolase family protein n=2 Tax=Streptomyces somaliensis TaxID=78355 RepID=UPI0020CE36AB|nr:GntG family PLP-dependent aldolase [Streptomyces somaliensis]MCP9945319.1 aminotransferase class I/II-fold pyridoxal phosphate-dependent enzyme [Streptomyces somaliensis]
MLDFRSDTVTRPTEAMLAAMVAAEVGDGGYGEDVTTNELERTCADMLGMEDAVFMTSGTLSNQCALQIHAGRGDEVIIDQSSHLNTFESGSCAQLGQVALNMLETTDGFITAEGIDEALDKKRRLSWTAKPVLVGLENTINHHAGRALSPARIAATADYAKTKGLRVHLDGARLFNACVAHQVDVKEFAASVDTVSICFSKGLGAPFGSVLAGGLEEMRGARYYRKLFGGDLRQSGYMAAAALYALQHNIERLAEDHALAMHLAEGLRELGLRLSVEQPETNIINVVTGPTIRAPEFAAQALRHGLRVYVVSDDIVRFVTHLDVGPADAQAALKIVGAVLAESASQTLEPIGLMQ